MKGGVAMMLAAVLRAKAGGPRAAGRCDPVRCERRGGERRPTARSSWCASTRDLFDGVRYALGEFGGFTHEVAGRRFYPIMVAEKQVCWTRATVRGPAGHGSMPMRGGTMARLARLLHAAGPQRLPVHVTPVPAQMIDAMAGAAAGAAGRCCCAGCSTRR